MSSKKHTLFDFSKQYDPEQRTASWDVICLVTQYELRHMPTKTSGGQVYMREDWVESSFLCKDISPVAAGLVAFEEPLFVSAQRKLVYKGVSELILQLGSQVRVQVQTYADKALFFERLHSKKL